MEKALAPPARCPAPPLGEREVCGVPCQFDFQCSRYDACCRSHECGTHCVPTTNKTKCEQKRQLAELMMINEKQGRGYVPQCTEDGSFERRQCSRNGLVCWCVDPDGTNVRGTMGPADGVVCHPSDVNRISSGRSLGCATLRCAEVCQYGHQPDASGCPTCQCVRPCDEYPCPEGTVCVATPTPGCHGPLCQATPSCVAFEIQGTPDIPEQPQTDSQQTPNEGLTETHQSELMTTNMHQMKAATEQNQLPTEGATGSGRDRRAGRGQFPAGGRLDGGRDPQRCGAGRGLVGADAGQGAAAGRLGGVRGGQRRAGGAGRARRGAAGRRRPPGGRQCGERADGPPRSDRGRRTDGGRQGLPPAGPGAGERRRRAGGTRHSGGWRRAIPGQRRERAQRIRGRRRRR
ncbi:translation initiation factor IF-2-like [Pollicipes pollicipes]|uniref:translation initiation factor IF-2-like n=1 Tax=Pollicipes pollicipes TaxID=41117 RepID=UPI0018856C2F|nr:translation initiation factor IF-2-like [Pollicipes pollicipes]